MLSEMSERSGSVASAEPPVNNILERPRIEIVYSELLPYTQVWKVRSGEHRRTIVIRRTKKAR